MSKKRSFLLNALALFLCLVMLLGSTYAWFTDLASSKDNVIHSGVLDVEMYWSDTLIPENSSDWKKVESASMFTYDKWEPGYTEVKYIKVENAGNLSFKWKLNIEAQGDVSKLAEVVDVYCVNPVVSALTEGDINAGNRVGTLADTIGNSEDIADGVLLTSDQVSAELPSVDTILAVAFRIDSGVGNEYMGLSMGDGFALTVSATQFNYEQGSFGDSYDSGAEWPNTNLVVKNSASAPVNTTAENKVADKVTLISDDRKIFADVPAGVQLDPDVDTLTLTVADVLSSKANVTLDENEAALSIDVHVNGVAETNDVVMPITIKELLPVGLNMGNYRFYHVENGATVEMELLTAGATPVHNNYDYNPATGDVVLYLKSFSEVALVAEPAKWEGNFSYDWFITPTLVEGETIYTIANADQLAAFGAIVGGMNGKTAYDFTGMTVKLVNDISIGDLTDEDGRAVMFYPIGYYNNTESYNKVAGKVSVGEEEVAVVSGFRNFAGTFDGNGHTISDWYQNTWEAFGDYNDGYSGTPNHFRDGFGLFGKVYKGTVKNLTVKNFSSDGEYTTTGVIAAYADGATFENIAIFDCNPRVYNIGNGGIVGCVGWYAKEANLKTTFENITVDNSNKISALWGSYDVACGGIVGQYYPTSGQSSAGTPKNAGISFENCHVSAQMDVYNDVCANYQYYAYRYTGMFIGSVRENVTIDGHVYPKMDGITASGCTVHFGDWNDYYYCELVANSLASYTHDHQMSRLTQVASVDVENMKVTDLEGKTTDIPTSGRVNYVVVKVKDANGMWIHGDGHDYADCYHFVNGVQHFHDVADADNPNPTETVNGVETLKEDKQLVYREFNQLFTGYGWGVTSKGVTDYEGVENMDITIGDHEESVVKFEGKVEKLENSKTYTLGDIFRFVDNGVKLVPSAISVGVTNLDENGNVSAEFVRNSDNWENGTITLTGTGKVNITIQDYYFCTPTTITVEITDREPEVKFETKFIGDFLYRVGNASGSTVALGTLFTGTNVTNGNVTVAFESVAGNASGIYSANPTDWTKGTIQFNGTGVVKVTITDNDYCIPTELLLEVVEAKNIISATGSLDGTDVVLLNNVKVSSNGTINYRYCTVYGNGFTIDVKGGMNKYNSKQGHGIIITIDAVLDNLVIVGDVYDTYGAYSTQEDYTSAIDATNTVIQNCHISNCSAPVRANGVTIKNTTLYGGTVANLIISGGTITLEDVTTVNYNDGRGVLGFGIVVSDGANETVKLIINGDLKQYNFISENDISAVKDDNAQKLFTAMFEESYSSYHFTKDNVKYVNPGILSMVDTFDTEDITNNTNNGYTGTTVSYKVLTETLYGYLYSLPASGNAVDNDYVKDEYTFVQGDYLPTFSFNLGDQALAKDDDEDTRYLIGDKNGIEALYQNNESPISLDLTKLANATKYNNNLNVSAIYKDANGNILGTDTTVQLTTNGTLVFSVTDNIFYNNNGERIEKSVVVIFEVPVDVSVKEAAIKNAEIKVNKTSIDGDYNSSKYMTFNPLEAITITDYDASGTGTTVTLNKNISSSTVEYANSSSGAWGGATITITYTDGRMLTVLLGTSTLNSPGASNGGKTITIQSNGSIKTDGKVANSSATGGTWTINGYSFKGNNGSTVSNNTKVTVNFKDESGCVTSDTLVMLADGSQKRIDEVTQSDYLLVWNFFEGKLDIVPAAIIFYHGDELYEVLTLEFEDGTKVKTINVHGFFDESLNEFVFIDKYNVEQYIGHKFIKTDGQSIDEAELIGYTITEECTGSYSIQSAMHINFITEGMLSLTVPPFKGWFDYFEIGEDMKYDEAKMNADIEKYGLYEYDDFAEYVTYEQFIAFNGPYLKVLVGRGVVTHEQILVLIATYVK